MSDEVKGSLLPSDYPEFVESLKQRIQAAQVKAALSVNSEMIMLYWGIGHDILVRQQEQGWGAKVIQKLSEDLQIAFPGVRGFSSRNLKYMRALAEAWPDNQIVQEVLAQITWYHNLALIEKLKQSEERLWYARQIVKNGWSRNVLVHQIEGKLYERQAVANKTTNFTETLPTPESDLANQLIKDPYSFDFLTLSEDHKEKDLQCGLIKYLRDFLLELGVGFAFVGDNYHLEVEGEDYYVDLLFYHYHLRSFVVIELKARKFDPRDVGQLNFYLSAVDDLIRHPDDNPTIGLLLCKDKKHITAEYALRGTSQPMGVSEYKTAALPEELKDKLPTVEEIEQRLSIPSLDDENEES